MMSDAECLRIVVLILGLVYGIGSIVGLYVFLPLGSAVGVGMSLISLIAACVLLFEWSLTGFKKAMRKRAEE